MEGERERERREVGSPPDPQEILLQNWVGTELKTELSPVSQGYGQRPAYIRPVSGSDNLSSFPLGCTGQQQQQRILNFNNFMEYLSYDRNI
ncbi:hypothetical protein TNCV_919211 [Trichonephila clavipes]|nr:hypothetical protein TNCV_919211 [Trichonephila clavipes]